MNPDSSSGQAPLYFVDLEVFDRAGAGLARALDVLDGNAGSVVASDAQAGEEVDDCFAGECPDAAVHRILAQDWCDGPGLDYFPCAAESRELVLVQFNLGRGSGHTIACLVGFRAFAKARLDGSRGGGMVSGISAAVGGDPIILVVRDTFLNALRIAIQVVPVGDTVYLSVGKVQCRQFSWQLILW